MNYINVEKGNSFHFEVLNNLMYEYISETDLHSGTSTPKDIISKITKSMIDKLNENRYLKFVFMDNEPVGFCYAKIDRIDDKGDVRPGWGYIMEFFIRSTFRRKGLGKELAVSCEQFFKNNDVKNIWLTADDITGVPFWKALGYHDTGEISKENNQMIFIKSLI